MIINFILDIIPDLAFFLTVFVGYILQIIGLIFKNHFLIIPGLITVFCRLFVNINSLFYYYIFWLEEKHEEVADEEEEEYRKDMFLDIIILIVYCLISFYYIVLAMVWYNKLSTKYHLELRAKRFGEPALNYASLSNSDYDCENENGIVENHDEITITNEAYNELYAATLETNSSLK